MRKTILSSFTLLLTLATPAIAGASQPVVCSDFPDNRLTYALGQYSAAELDSSLEATLDAHLTDIVTQYPGDPSQISQGAVLLVARHKKIVYHKAIGNRDGNPQLGGSTTALMATNTIFDLESMTKPFTAAVILRMHDEGVLDIDDLVIDYLPDFEYVYDANTQTLVPDPDKADVTIRDLMRYMSGLEIDAVGQIYGVSDPYLDMSHEELANLPGTTVLYSDLGYRLLAHVAESAYGSAVSPKTFRELVALYITGPVAMSDTDFEPAVTAPAKMSRVAGTGNFAHYGIDLSVPLTYQWGEVQDDQDWWTTRHDALFPNVVPAGTGCDGLFSTAYDLAKFAQVLLNGGVLYNSQTHCHDEILSNAAVTGLTSNQTNLNADSLGSYTYDLLLADKAFGFELMDGVDSPGGTYLRGVFKTGGAGTFLLIDPDNDVIIVVLTNHGLPDFNNFVIAFDEMVDEIGPHRIADSVASALLGSSSF